MKIILIIGIISVIIGVIISEIRNPQREDAKK